CSFHCSRGGKGALGREYCHQSGYKIFQCSMAHCRRFGYSEGYTLPYVPRETVGTTMAANNIKLQRTFKGEGEIRKKSHSLTQSQRLVLAAVDGVSQIAELQRRLSGMARRRFTLAVADLTARGLVEEAKNPMIPDKLDLRMVEHFVRQDPLDPITISALYLQAPPRPAAKPAMSSKPSPEVDFFIHSRYGKIR